MPVRVPSRLRRIAALAAVLPLACQSRTYVPETQATRYRSPIPSQAWTRDLAHPGTRAVVPLGGIGTASIGLDSSGQFARWHFLPGRPEDRVNGNDAFFAYQRTGSRPAVSYRLDGDTLGPGQAVFHALFPRLWMDYSGLSEFPARLHVSAFSPLIPERYDESALPVAVFNWEAWNPTDMEVDVGLCLAWEHPFAGPDGTVTFRRENETAALVLDGAPGDARKGTDVEFAIALRAPSELQLTTAIGFPDASAVGRDFGADGQLAAAASGKGNRAAFAVRFTLAPHERHVIPVVIAWDAPIAEFPADASKHGGSTVSWYRKYTSTIGTSGRNAFAIAKQALDNAVAWEAAIAGWQEGVLDSKAFPDWMKTSLFNELSVLADGGALWENGTVPGSPQKDDPADHRFAPLTSPERGTYGDSDALLYGAYPYLALWPELEKQMVRQLFDGETGGFPAVNFGSAKDPAAPPLVAYNAGVPAGAAGRPRADAEYVLRVWRDFDLSGAGNKDLAFLRACWEPVKRCVARLRELDRDGDGMPDGANDDAGLDSLLPAVILAHKEMAKVLEENKAAKGWEEWLASAVATFEKRHWNGACYRTASGGADRLCADALAGAWVAGHSRLPAVLPLERIQATLRELYVRNTLGFDLGRSGVAASARLEPAAAAAADAGGDRSAGPEVQVATAYAAAAFMIQEGLVKYGERAAWGLYRLTYGGDSSFAFRTPAAWGPGGKAPADFRSAAAGGVWALKLAYDRPHYHDDQGPTPVASTSGESTSTSEAEIRWEPATDNVAVDYYIVYRTTSEDEYHVGTVPAIPGMPLTFHDYGLASNTSYHYRIGAVDAASNVGTYSEEIRVKTLPTPEDLAREKALKEKMKGNAPAEPDAPLRKKRTWER